MLGAGGHQLPCKFEEKCEGGVPPDKTQLRQGVDSTPTGSI